MGREWTPRKLIVFAMGLAVLAGLVGELPWEWPQLWLVVMSGAVIGTALEREHQRSRRR